MLVSNDYFRTTFSLAETIKDSRFERLKPAASKMIRSMVGDEAYDDAISVSPTDPARKELLTEAEAYMLMSLAVFNLSSHVSKLGAMIEAREEGGGTTKYWTPNMVGIMSESFRSIGEQISLAYRTSGGIPDPPIMIVP